MRERINRHRADREGQGWLTVEEPLGVMQVIRDAMLGSVLVDCAFKHAWNSSEVLAEVDLLCAVLANPPVDVAVVSNEVGNGIVPDTDMGRAFRDLHGFANQRLAAACHQVTMVVAGLPLHLK